MNGRSGIGCPGAACTPVGRGDAATRGRGGPAPRIRAAPSTVLALALLLAPAALWAQAPTLDRADSLLAAGEYAAARTVVAAWWKAHPGGKGAEPALRARALYLRGRLSTIAKEAEQDFLALVQGYPTSRLAPDALLRLGQSLLARGDADRAVAYLGRLTTDYPNAASRPAGLLWLARADHAAGKEEAACAAARAGARAAAKDAALGGLLQAEAGARCSGSGSGRTAAARRAPSSAPVRQVSTAEGPAGAFALQSGAFRNRSGADHLASRLRRAGFDARLARLSGGHLYLVRVGRYPSASSAASAAKPVRAAGFEALVVDDARREERVR